MREVEPHSPNHRSTVEPLGYAGAHMTLLGCYHASELHEAQHPVTLLCGDWGMKVTLQRALCSKDISFLGRTPLPCLHETI